MATPTLPDLRLQINDLNSRYEAFFAGQPRISRDANLMDSLAASLRTIVATLEGLPPGADRDEALATARSNLSVYEGEGARIREAQAGGPDALEAHRLSTWATFATRRYVRHFAGKSRPTRDLGLLTELIEDLKRLHEDLSALAQDYRGLELDDARRTVDQSLQLYQAERTAIEGARAAAGADELTDILAQVANDQFQSYQDHFAGKSRASRRPDLLRRIVDNLVATREAMLALRDRFPDQEHNKRNIEVVESRLSFYQAELEEIRKSRQESKFPDIVAALGAAANQVFAEYRENYAGKDRKTRDLTRLSLLCDQLYEVAHQMDDLDRVREDEMNLQNLSIVLDNLRLYEREYDEIVRVRAPPATP